MSKIEDDIHCCMGPKTALRPWARGPGMGLIGAMIAPRYPIGRPIQIAPCP